MLRTYVSWSRVSTGRWSLVGAWRPPGRRTAAASWTASVCASRVGSWSWELDSVNAPTWHTSKRREGGKVVEEFNTIQDLIYLSACHKTNFLWSFCYFLVIRQNNSKTRQGTKQPKGAVHWKIIQQRLFAKHWSWKDRQKLTKHFFSEQLFPQSNGFQNSLWISHWSFVEETSSKE